MNLKRRQFLQFGGAAAAFPGFLRLARAEPYPTRPIRLVVGFAAGGGTDIVARIMAEWLSERLRQQFVVENRTGMGGNLANQAVINSPADGYTLLFTGSNS